MQTLPSQQENGPSKLNREGSIIPASEEFKEFFFYMKFYLHATTP